MNEIFEKALKKYKPKIADERIYLSPNIPEKKLHNAIKSYGNGADADSTLLLADDTVFGSAKNGFLITSQGIHGKSIAGPAHYCSWEEIKEISAVKNIISVNYNEFLDLSLPDQDSVSYIIEMISEIIASLSHKEEPSQSDNTDIIDDHLFLELKKIQADYGASSKILLHHQINAKQRNNFCQNCKIENPGDILAFIDTTIMNSGKDGVAFCKDHIVWRNFAFDEPQQISYEELYNAVFRINGNDLLFETKKDRIFKLNAVSCELKPQNFSDIFKRLADFWRNNFTELTEEEEIEDFLLNLLQKPQDNYFIKIQDNLIRDHRLNSIGNHLEHVFDIFSAISQEQQNDAHRRNVFNENDERKKFVTTTHTLLKIANNFPTYINKEKIYPAKFITALQNEYVSFEILILIMFKSSYILGKVLGTEATHSLLNKIFVSPIILPYIQYKVRTNPSCTEQRTRSLHDVVNPQVQIANSIIMKALTLRRKDFEERGEVEISIKLIENLIKSIVLQRDDYFDEIGLSPEEDEIYNVIMYDYIELLADSISEYTRNLDKAIEQTFVKLLTSI